MSLVTFDQYYPFSDGAGANATSVRWRTMARNWVQGGSGVIQGYLNSCAPTFLGGNTVSVDIGGVWIDGFYGENSSPKTVNTPADGMVVARMDPVGETIGFIFIAGQTVPTQLPTGIYEIPVASVKSGVMTDIRQFVTPITAPPGMPNPPVSGIGSYQDQWGVWWVAKAGVNNGLWRRATDALHARLGRNGALTQPNTWANVPYDTIVHDPYALWNPPPFTSLAFVVPVPGTYRVTAQITVNIPVNQWVNHALARNGTQFNWNGLNSNGGWLPAPISDSVFCAANDKITSQTTGSQALPFISGAPNWFAIDYLGSG